jgi:hypothetical protein
VTTSIRIARKLSASLDAVESEKDDDALHEVHRLDDCVDERNFPRATAVGGFHEERVDGWILPQLEHAPKLPIVGSLTTLRRSRRRAVEDNARSLDVAGVEFTIAERGKFASACTNQRPAEPRGSVSIVDVVELEQDCVVRPTTALDAHRRRLAPVALGRGRAHEDFGDVEE